MNRIHSIQLHAKSSLTVPYSSVINLGRVTRLDSSGMKAATGECWGNYSDIVYCEPRREINLAKCLTAMPNLVIPAPRA
jgi:hypothetical protein